MNRTNLSHHNGEKQSNQQQVFTRASFSHKLYTYLHDVKHDVIEANNIDKQLTVFAFVDHLELFISTWKHQNWLKLSHEYGFRVNLVGKFQFNKKKYLWHMNRDGKHHTEYMYILLYITHTKFKVVQPAVFCSPCWRIKFPFKWNFFSRTTMK